MRIVTDFNYDLYEGVKEGFRNPKNIEITIPGEENPCPADLFCPGKKFILTCQGESHIFSCDSVELEFFDSCVPGGFYYRAIFECDEDADDVSEGFPCSFDAFCKLLPWRAADRYVAELDDDDYLWFCKQYGIGPDQDEGDREDVLKECKDAWWDLYDSEKESIIWEEFNYENDSFLNKDFSDELYVLEWREYLR